MKTLGVWALIAIIVGGLYYAYSGKAQLVEAQCRAFRPIIDGVRPSLKHEQPPATHVVLSKPYLLVRLRDPFLPLQTISGCWTNVWITDLYRAKTLILVDQDVVGAAQYSVTRKSATSTSNRPTQYRERHRYDLWAVDVPTRSVVAYGALTDAPLRDRYETGDSSYADTVSDVDIEKWADATIAASQSR